MSSGLSGCALQGDEEHPPLNTPHVESRSDSPLGISRAKDAGALSAPRGIHRSDSQNLFTCPRNRHITNVGGVAEACYFH